jgi:hypothetical protein
LSAALKANSAFSRSSLVTPCLKKNKKEKLVGMISAAVFYLTWVDLRDSLARLALAFRSTSFSSSRFGGSKDLQESDHRLKYAMPGGR